MIVNEYCYIRPFALQVQYFVAVVQISLYAAITLLFAYRSRVQEQIFGLSSSIAQFLLE